MIKQRAKSGDFAQSNNKKIERQIYSEKKIEFKGIVKQKYIDSLNHVRPTIKLYGGTKISSDYELYNMVRINDSISKENEELSIKIYRKKDDTINYKYIESVYRNSLYRNYKQIFYFNATKLIYKALPCSEYTAK